MIPHPSWLSALLLHLPLLSVCVCCNPSYTQHSSTTSRLTQSWHENRSSLIYQDSYNWTVKQRYRRQTFKPLITLIMAFSLASHHLSLLFQPPCILFIHYSLIGHCGFQSLNKSFANYCILLFTISISLATDPFSKLSQDESQDQRNILRCNMRVPS